LPELLRRWDPVALDAAMREHAGPLYAVARALGADPAEAEDLVQDTMMTFLETVERFEGRSTVRTWLTGILYNKTLERRRAKAQESQIGQFEKRESQIGGSRASGADVERLLLSKEAGAVIRACLGHMPHPQRNAFLLREMEGLGTKEICGILEVSETNLGVLLHRARKRMQSYLAARGYGSGRQGTEKTLRNNL
jgi:RNA polymerase sigma-70 factor (ECF subfamily)